MKAFTKYSYGGPEVLRQEEVNKPEAKEGELLVKVKANSANPADWHILRGEPILARFAFGLFKPKLKILGADFAGVVEAVGTGVSGFQIGDRVFGETLKAGAFAEFTNVPASACATMPEGSSYLEMASVSIAGVTAYQALITHGKLKEGESVLINGSSGGVGHFAVQIAKVYGAKVTAVCSSKNRDFVEALGADQVLAYDEEDIHKHEGSYDLILDNHGNLFLNDFMRMGSRGVVVGFTGMKHMMQLLIQAGSSKFPLAQFTAEAKTEDLQLLANLIKEEKLKVHIEKTYPYTEIPQAIGYIESMRTRGKVAMNWEADD